MPTWTRQDNGVIKVVKKKCQYCHHEKAWKKHGKYECTKCRKEIE